MFIIYPTAMIVGLIALLLTLPWGVGVIVSTAAALRLAVHGVSATGTVTRVLDQEPGWVAEVQVTYETPEGTFTTEGTSEFPWKGSSVPVRYNPAKPSQATTLVRPWVQAIFKVPLVLLGFVSAAGLVVSGYWYLSGTHTSSQDTLLGAAWILGFGLIAGSYALSRYTIMLHSRRMLQAEGTVRRYAERSPIGPGILISFPTAEGPREFWTRRGSITVSQGDTVPIRYLPEQPITTATVREASDVRFTVIVATLVATVCIAAALYQYSTL